MRPLIGITVGEGERDGVVALSWAYVRAVEAGGGTAVLVPPGTDAEAVAGRIDGILLPGGPDVAPELYGEEPRPGLGRVDPDRDRLEVALSRVALARGIPILAVCRGIQVLNVAAGGTLIQDVEREVPGSLQHRQQAPRWHRSHSVEIAAGTRVAAILGEGSLRVNSFHHQAVRGVAAGFRPSARAADGVVEAIESPTHPFAVGVQWHPEDLWEREPLFLRLFEALVAASADAWAGRVRG